MPGFTKTPRAGRGGAPGKPVLKGRMAKKKAAKPRSAKAQIRDLNRLLQKGTLPAKAAKELAARVEALTKEQGKRQLAAREKQMSLRYHKIKFFERRKLERRVRVLQRRVAAATEGNASEGLDGEDLQRQLRQAQEDLQYVLFFPPAEKYVSVIKDPGELEGEAREKLESERKRLRGLAFARRAEQAMVNEADEGVGLLGPQQDALSGPAAKGEPEEQDDFFLQDADSDSDALPSLAAPLVLEDSKSTTKRPRGPLPGAVPTPDPIAVGLEGPVAKRPHVNPPVAEPIPAAATRCKLQPSAPSMPSPLMPGALLNAQPMAASKPLRLDQDPVGSPTSGSDADSELGGVSSSMSQEQILPPRHLPADSSTQAGDPSDAADMHDRQPHTQRHEHHKRHLDDVFDDSSASEPEAVLASSRQTDGQHRHPQLPPQSISQPLHMQDSTSRSIPDSISRGGIRHGNLGPNHGANNFLGSPHSPQKQAQRGKTASGRHVGAAIAAHQPDKLSTEAAFANIQRAKSVGQQSADGSQARLQRLQALAAAIQRKHQPKLEPHHEVSERPPRTSRHPPGMARDALHMAAGRVPDGQGDDVQVHAQQHQRYQPSNGAKPGGGVKRPDQHRGRLAGKVGGQAIKKASAGRKPPLSADMPLKSLAAAPKASFERGERAGKRPRPDNAPKPALDGKRLRHDAAPVQPKQSQVAVAAGTAAGGPAEAAAKGRTRAEGGRKRRKRK